MSVLVMMRGLPRSGKSTKARELSDRFGWPTVCLDSIRLALHGQAFYGPAESLVLAHAKLMVRALFLSGHQRVILDATNLTRNRRDFWRDPEYDRALVPIHTPVQTCLDRADGNEELKAVIQRMADEIEFAAPDELFVTLPEWSPKYV